MTMTPVRRDPTLTHQVGVFVSSRGQQLYVTCNCMHGQPIGNITDFSDTVAAYNNPAAHSLPFTDEDRIGRNL